VAQLQQPNIVGNFLSSYATAQDRQREQQDAMYQRERQGRADQMVQEKHAMDMDTATLNRTISMLQAEEDFFSRVPDNVSQQQLEPFKQQYSQLFNVPPEKLAHITPDKIPGIKMRSGQLLKELQIKAQEANIRQSNAAVDATRASTARANAAAATIGGYPAGYRKPPDGIQGKDYKVIEGYSQASDAAANIASVYSAAKKALDQNMTGPGASVKRAAASVIGLLPNLGVEEFLTGENRTQNIIDTYDAVDQASKMQGIEALKGIGGSDTERELLTAIQTGVNNDASPEENRRRVRNQLAAADILSKKAQLASEWVNRFGSLQYAAPDGTTWQKAWPQYQRQNWAAHLAREERLAQGAGKKSGTGANEWKIEVVK
jgi:hypothetical protein